MSLKRNIILAASCWMALFFFEWTFFTTKISFMSPLSMVEKVGILLIPIAPFLLAHILLVLIAYAICLLLPPKEQRIAQWVPVFPAALVAACLVTLLVENFTYTIFNYNMAYATGLARFIYTIPFLALVAYLTIRMLRWIGKPDSRFDEAAYKLSLAVTAVTLIAVTLALITRNEDYDTTKYSSEGENLPNIVFFIADSVQADNSSLYGYERNTTPALVELARDSLVAENFFSNSTKTTGALGAFYTGKSPTKTRLIYRPDILRGSDSYKHLPGILRKLGYRNYDASMRHHADPEDLNLKEGFDFANGRHLSDEESFASFAQPFFPHESYFVRTVYERVQQRLAHIFAVNDMVNVHDVVATPDSAFIREKFSDSGRLQMLADEISRSNAPFFAHAHLLITHGRGGKYKSRHRRWSVNKRQTDENKIDFFDDAVLEADALMDEFLRFLIKIGRFENTIFIYASDHGPSWNPAGRLPLVMRFPGGKHKGTIKNNVQMLDLAPTLLDYLGVEIPSWMEGISLISPGYPPRRPVMITFSSEEHTPEAERRGGRSVIKNYTAPFYSLGELGVVVGNRLYKLDLASNKLTSSQIDRHTAPLEAAEIPTTEQARAMILSHLRDSGYDLSSLTGR